ncbi:MAG: ArsR family transcriptional regulator [Candidatus Hodarchaeota archaeon]
MLKLLKEGAMNIIELSKALEWNPGTVKRHIDQLLLYNLIYLSQTVKNEFGFTLKYYRASAILYKILIEWE